MNIAEPGVHPCVRFPRAVGFLLTRCESSRLNKIYLYSFPVSGQFFTSKTLLFFNDFIWVGDKANLNL